MGNTRARSHAQKPAHRGRRRGRALAALLSALLVVVGVVAASPAYARYAEGGAGRFLTSIDWIEWGTSGQVISNGAVATSTRTIDGQQLVTRCTISNVSGVVTAYRSGNWRGDGLDDLYNIGGTGTSNQLIAGLSNRDNGAQVRFDFSCAATLAGVAIPLAGLVVADAESSNFADGQNEYITVRPLQTTATWRIIDRYRTAACTTYTNAELATTQALTMRPSGRECTYTNTSWTGPIGVGFMQGATSANVIVQGAGYSAVALGVVLYSDFGDAPASYGTAGALYEPGWTGGGLVAGTTTNIFDSTFVMGSQTQPLTRLGAIVDPDTAHRPSAGAIGDDSTQQSDEDAIPKPGTIAVTPGNTYTQSGVSCTGPGWVTGWIDWNRNGTFDTGEKSDAQQCTGTSVALTWTVPADARESRGTDLTYMRLRIAGTAPTSPTGLTTSGEVEDYALNVTLPQLAITKTSTATADTKVGDVVTYTVTARNTTTVPYTTSYPARVVDDLTNVLDDATYRNDATANKPGTLSYTAPRLSWQGALAAGDSVQITYSTVVKAGGNGTVRNVAWVPSSSTPGPTPACTSGTGTDTATGQPCATTQYLLPKLQISKDTTTTQVTKDGQEVTYRVTLTNPGPGSFTTASPASMSDDLSGVLDDAEYVTAKASAGPAPVFDAAGKKLTWQGPLTAGQSVTIDYTVRFVGGGDNLLHNVACIPKELLPAGTTDACDTVDLPAGELTAWKTVESDTTPTTAGSVLTYTLHFANGGRAPVDVDMVDDLTHVLDDADVTRAAQASSTALTVTGPTSNRLAIKGTIPVGETVTVTYQVTVKAADRGDDVAANFLLKPGAPTPPSTECVPEDPDAPTCTVTPIDPTPGSLTWMKAVAGTVTTDNPEGSLVGGSVWELTGPGYPAGAPLVIDDPDQDGRFSVTGLAVGDYTLTEVTPPPGYRITEASEPITVTITKTALHIDLGSIENAQRTLTLPIAGGPGTALYLAGGGLVITLALLLWLVPRLRRRTLTHS
ncbi:isopeptide-forming domain-containing fimbrial protein [Microbacterium paludicola]|uniref:Isopeptide-forming domain-containing fimbrial protein n=1 Tax=Microbacterium paludicola TaxID=300019 RepID=A0A4Y9FTS1_9MICO|nr:CshA/CshB family fibrillar adhesin-related protein [Microbacterium paludicola]MBF0816879.1 isopeptide-forming domain-containing fimbrial protein [Microbacterium paludicola]TFU32400.1 isopeptide-forming domain-containing fimbrial protein [Microbacterium paludicola]